MSCLCDRSWETTVRYMGARHTQIYIDQVMYIAAWVEEEQKNDYMKKANPMGEDNLAR